MDGIENCPHAIIIPKPGQGHVPVCMLLARALAGLGFKVTFVCFSTYYAKLKESNRIALPQLSSTAQGGDHPAPASSQSTNDSSADEAAASKGIIELRVVEDGIAPGDIHKPFVTPTMKENLFNLILELRELRTPPTCLVSDAFMPWTLHVAERACIPHVSFCVSNAFAYLMAINLPSLFSQGIFPETGSSTQWKSETPSMLDHIPGLPPFSSEFHPHQVRFADPSHPMICFLKEVSSSAACAERILLHTIPDIEEEALRAFQVAGMPTAYGVGPLFLHTETSQKPNTAASSQVESISWLDTQADSSVIFIAFGSVVSLCAEEVQELALGLEASGSPFLWALREDSLDGGAEPTHALPKGFRERTSKRGMVMGWAPQMEVLAHRAIGGFFTHCGWNSTLESLWHGVPVLCCPRVAEQRVNLHYLCNVWGAGLELERTETGGFHRGSVELGVKALMQDDAGRKARGKAQEMKQLARTTCQPGGLSHGNLQKFYDDMKLLCSKSRSH